MALTHRMEKYHEMLPPPPPPLPLKAKHLKSAMKGQPVYVLLPPNVVLPPDFNGSVIYPASLDGTWAPPGPTFQSGNVSSISSDLGRFRPERTILSRPVQKSAWKNPGFQYRKWSAAPSVTTMNSGGNHSEDSARHKNETRITSMTISDVSPRLALKKVLSLYENRQFRDTANFVNRLSHGTFKVILHDLPVDAFIEAMPQSLCILEALYAKVFLSDGLNSSLKFLKPDAVVMQVVKFFALQDDFSVSQANNGNNGTRWEFCGPFICSCKKLLKVIVLSDPTVKKSLQQRRKTLEKAIEGLGQHGMVGTSDQSLVNLHDALRLEFDRVVQSYKIALQKLEELELTPKANQKPKTGAPIQSSHQRQLSFHQEEIQERLIKNKTLLNVVEPTLTNHSLDLFLGILQRRIEYDKDALFQFTQLRKEMKNVEPNAVVAPVLMRFSHGCQQVLDLMKEVSEDGLDAEDDSSDVSGYHSDSDSTVMMSGNSPFVSKSARYNFLTRSVRAGNRARTSVLVSSLSLDTSNPKPKSKEALKQTISESPSEEEPKISSASSSSGSDSDTSPRVLPPCQRCQSQPMASIPPPPPPPLPSMSHTHDRHVAALQAEIETLKTELGQTRVSLAAAQEREMKSKERLAIQAQHMAERGVCGAKFEASNQGDKRPTALIRRYAHLYSQSRVDALDALDSLPQLKEADELKSKLLFSVIVLAFRSAQNSSAQIRDHVKRILQISPSPLGSKGELEKAARQVEQSITSYLKLTIANFDLTKNVEDVCSQIWATLYDYPCLMDCEALTKYVKECVRLAWGLVNQSPAFVLEYENRSFQPDMHVRFHTSQQNSDTIKTYFWPALMEGRGGPCVHKGVVLT